MYRKGDDGSLVLSCLKMLNMSIFLDYNTKMFCAAAGLIRSILENNMSGHGYSYSLFPMKCIQTRKCEVTGREKLSLRQHVCGKGNMRLVHKYTLATGSLQSDQGEADCIRKVGIGKKSLVLFMEHGS